jgi:Tn7-like transposition protein D/TniQ
MLVQMPRPYPDELLYSTIARYVAYFALSWRAAYIALFGFRNSARLDLPTGLSELSNRTTLTWNRTALQIATEMTLFPYFVRFLPEEKADVVLAMMSGRNILRGNHLNTRLGLSSSTIKSPSRLMFCKACRELDLEKYGETYWRRGHQLPGTFVCFEHRCLLYQSATPHLPSNNWVYFNASACTLLEGAIPISQFTLSEMRIAHAIALHSYEILCNPLPLLQKDTLFTEYRAQMIERGFVDRSDNFSAVKAEAALCEFYGDKLLRLLGCTIAPGRSGWLRTMLQPSKTASRHPLRHIILQVFFENCVPSSAPKFRYGTGIWKCPNPFGEHTTQLPIRACKSKPLLSTAPVISAQCSCGMRFAFSNASPSDPALSRISSVRQLAPSWSNELIRLRASGRSIKAIAEQNGLPMSCVKKALANPQSTIGDQERLSLLRLEWSKVLSNTPSQNRSLARERNARVYAELKMLDPIWLRNSGTRKSNRRRLTAEDWLERDRTWAARLSTSFCQLRAKHLSVKISATKVIINAGLKMWILSKPHQLPKCQRVLLR